MRVAIAQPTYLPWLGYFDLIDQVDAFVILDSVQFEKQSWQQRNRIKTPAGLQWLTVPVIRRFGQLIDDVEIRDVDFWRNHLRAIELNYRRAPFFENYFRELSGKLRCSERSRLVALNVRLIEWLMSVFGIRTPLFLSSRLDQPGKRTQLLANICACLGASEYVSPLGSVAYLSQEIDIFQRRSIDVVFQNYEHPSYRQMFAPFVPYASILDLIFNEGERSLEIVRSGRRDALLPEQAGSQLFAHHA
jgi:WbqC-like protein family